MSVVYAGPPSRWDSLSKTLRESYSRQFAELVTVARELGIRIEDDQTPHGPAVSPPGAIKLQER